MNPHALGGLFLLIILGFWSCSSEEALDEIDKSCEIDITSIDFSFGMNYETPELYLRVGEQSEIDSIHLSEVEKSIGNATMDIDFIRDLCYWVNQEFIWVNAGGSMIGEVTAKELMESKKLYGCHSAALLISSLLRGFGYPALLMETASVNWAYSYKEGKTKNLIGHVMSEIFVKDSWILLDNNGDFIAEYDPLNPFVNTNNAQIRSLFVIAKGLDTWDYYEKTNADTDKLMRDFSENVYCFEHLYDTVKYNWSH